MPDVAFTCSRCGHAMRLMVGDKIQRRDSCAGCSADLHACIHCRYFDPGRSNQCAEPEAEWVGNKEAANFCGYFEPRTSVNLTARGGTSKQDDARAAFDALFEN